MQLFTNYKNYTYFRNTNSEESKKLEEKKSLSSQTLRDNCW